MGRVLPIFFNGDMVRAILSGSKTVTRRCVKNKYSNTEMKMHTDKYGTRLIEIQRDVEGETFGRNEDGTTWHKLRGYIEPKPPYQPGDILYVRETWQYIDFTGVNNGYVYKASDNGKLWEKETEDWKWSPSIHMPKEAARIWLKVTDVRVERLQKIKENPIEVRREGIGADKAIFTLNALEKFSVLWDSTCKKACIDRYGWNANPWVWVIEFERCEKPDK